VLIFCQYLDNSQFHTAYTKGGPWNIGGLDQIKNSNSYCLSRKGEDQCKERELLRAAVTITTYSAEFDIPKADPPHGVTS